MEGKLRRGRPLRSRSGKATREINMTVLVTPAEKELLESRSQELKVPVAGIFRGFIRQMSQREVNDPIILTIDETPVAIPRSEAKVLLLDLTSKLVDG